MLNFCYNVNRQLSAKVNIIIHKLKFISLFYVIKNVIRNIIIPKLKFISLFYVMKNIIRNIIIVLCDMDIKIF